MGEKEALIERAEQNLRMSSEVRYPADERQLEEVLYRRVSVQCAEVLSISPRAGTSASGAKGWAQRASCNLANGAGPVVIDLGWSRRPEPATWGGGEVRGIIGPGGRIVSAAGLAGLDPLVSPNPRTLPNNHLAYAGQWFFFALTALVIYGLVLRSRSRSAARGTRDD
jgi:surfeit locus 1 family protein